MSKIKRRSFLKYTSAGASFLAVDRLFGNLFAAQSTFERGGYADRCTEKRVKGVPTTCTGCFAHCGMVAYVADGQLMKMSGNPAHPVNKGTLCMTGEASVYKLYDPERVTKPLVKAGKRGQNRWKEVTWEAALAIAAENIKAKGNRGVVLETLGGSSEHGKQGIPLKHRRRDACLPRLCRLPKPRNGASGYVRGPLRPA